MEITFSKIKKDYFHGRVMKCVLVEVIFFYICILAIICDNESRLVPCSIIQQYKYEYVMEPVYK
jgi:hypothetical protein